MRRHAAVSVEFLATLAIEIVLNRQHWDEFLHRLWRVKEDNIRLFWRVKENIFGSLWTNHLRVLGLMLAVFASNLMNLLGFLLILSLMHLIIDLNRWERGLPHLGRSDKSSLSLKRFNVFQIVDPAIKSVFAIAESDFPARCNANIASLLPDIFELAKSSNWLNFPTKTNGDAIKYCNGY